MLELATNRRQTRWPGGGGKLYAAVDDVMPRLAGLGPANRTRRRGSTR